MTSSSRTRPATLEAAYGSYTHVIQKLTPAVAATFAGAVEAAVERRVCNFGNVSESTVLRYFGDFATELISGIRLLTRVNTWRTRRDSNPPTF